MADARHFCPDCGNIELVIEDKLLVHVRPESEGAHRAKCPNCGWEGPLSKTVGAVTSEQFWDIERVGEVLLRVVSKHAAGPFVQVMEFVGLIPKKKTLKEFKEALEAQHEELGIEGAIEERLVRYNAMVDHLREQVVKEMLAATITAGFEAAEKAHRLYAEKTKTPLHPMLHDGPTSERQFGGNVTPLHGRKKGRRHDR